MQHSLSISRPLSMQRAIPFLVLLLAVQLGLAVGLALRRDPLTIATPQTPLIGAAAESADRIVIESTTTDNNAGGQKSMVLEKRNGQWVLPQHFDAPAAATKVSSVLSQLAGLKRGLPVATSTEALKRFKLVDAEFERRVQLSNAGKAIGTIYVGTSSGVHKAYARALADRAAYNVDVAGYDLSVDESDWIDAGMASRDLGSLAEIAITTDPHQSLQLRAGAARTAASASASQPAVPAASASAAQATTAWAAVSPTPGHEIDSAKVDSMAHDIGALQVQGALGQQPKPEWQMDHPQLSLTMKPSKGTTPDVTWTIAKPSSGDYYVLKSSQYPWYFEVATATGKELVDESQATALFKGSAAKAAAGAPTATKAGAGAPARPTGQPVRPQP